MAFRLRMRFLCISLALFLEIGGVFLLPLGPFVGAVAQFEILGIDLDEAI